MITDCGRTDVIWELFIHIAHFLLENQIYRNVSILKKVDVAVFGYINLITIYKPRWWNCKLNHICKLHLKGSLFRVLLNPPTHRSTDHRPLTHRPTDSPTTDPPTHRPNNRIYKTWQQKDFHFTEHSHSLENYFGLSSTWWIIFFHITLNFSKRKRSCPKSKCGGINKA